MLENLSLKINVLLTNNLIPWAQIDAQIVINARVIEPVHSVDGVREQVIVNLHKQLKQTLIAVTTKVKIF